MIKRMKTSISTEAATRINLKGLFRSALAAGVAAALVSSASAQTGLTRALHPTDPAALSLPLTEDHSYQFAPTPQQIVSPSASERVARLLGLKKQTSTFTFPHSAPAMALPSFPSTAPALVAVQCDAEQAFALGSPAPTIFRSTSGRSECRKYEQSEGAVVLVSTEETSQPIGEPLPVVVQTAVAISEPEQPLTESLTESLTDSLSESLIDIEISPSLTFPARDAQEPAQSSSEPAQNAQQRLPELVKRSPAMQLHIGGNAVRNAVDTASDQPLSNPAKFSFSDSSDSPSPIPVAQSARANAMNVRVEGEPIEAHAVTRQAASLITPTAVTKLFVEPSNRANAHKTLSDKDTHRSPSIGERQEVGLHESTNVETAQAISGLSVEHPELCQVLKSGDRSVSFVGLQTGQTRVALFTTDASGERKIEIRDVVIAGAENRLADMKSLATEIGRGVHKMYPDSRIEIIAEAEGLTVQGYASTEAEARKIISLVRRTSLQPVVDRLATYK